MEARHFADWLRQMEAQAPTEPELLVVPRDEHEQAMTDWQKFALAMLFLQIAMLMLVGVLVWAVLSR